MPVLVTGVEHAAGRLAVQRLAAGGGEVRVYCDLERDTAVDPAPLRGLGCKVAQGALDDEGHLETAMEQVHTVFHLAPNLLDDPARLLDVAATVVAAAIGAGCRRLVLLSAIGTAAPSGNAYLEAVAQAEGLAAEAPLESIVFRAALTYGPDDLLTAALAAGAAAGALRHGPPGPQADRPGGRHAPLWAGDLAAALAQADRDRAAAGAELHLVVPIAGPDSLEVAELVRALRGSPLAGRAGPPLPSHAAEYLTRDVIPPSDAIGRGGTALAQALEGLSSLGMTPPTR